MTANAFESRHEELSGAFNHFVNARHAHQEDVAMSVPPTTEQSASAVRTDGIAIERSGNNQSAAEVPTRYAVERDKV